MKIPVRITITIVALLSLAAPATGQQQSTGPGGVLASGFRGTIAYQGTHSGLLERGPKRGTRQYGGSLTIELTFNGDAVKGRFSGTGGINTGTMTGTRNGNHCYLVEDRGGDVIEGECTRTRFFATARSTGGRNSMSALFDARATQFVDAAVEEERRRTAAAEAAVRARERDAEGRRAAAAEAARIAALPRASAPQIRLLANALAEDSQSWLFNRYDSGSLTNVRIARTSGGATTLRGEYSYNGGSKGWLEGRVSGGRIQCLEFHDMAGCEPVRDAAFRKKQADYVANRPVNPNPNRRCGPYVTYPPGSITGVLEWGSC